MFKGLKVSQLDKETIVSMSPLADITLIFKYQNGLIKVDRIDRDILEENIYDIALAIISLSDTHNFHWLNQVLPPHLLETIKQFEYKQVPLFNAISGNKEFNQLFETAPILSWLIICFLDENFSAHSLNYFSLCKRKYLLTKLTNFKCEEKHVKFVNKIELKFGLEVEALLILKFISNEKVINSFRHKPSINSSELYLINKYPFLIGSNLLSKLASRGHNNLNELTIGIRDLLKIYQDTIDLGLALDFKDSNAIVSSCDNEEQIYQLHSQWIELLNKSNTYLNPDVEFEPFPYPNCSQFEYLSTINQLILEGQVMEHCVATYRNKALNKESFIFKVHSPERATLEVGFGGGVYFLKQLKLIRNAEPSSQTFLSVNAWIKMMNESLERIDLKKIGA